MGVSTMRRGPGVQSPQALPCRRPPLQGIRMVRAFVSLLLALTLSHAFAAGPTARQLSATGTCRIGAESCKTSCGIDPVPPGSGAEVRRMDCVRQCGVAQVQCGVRAEQLERAARPPQGSCRPGQTGVG
eukprot:gene39384-63056_t